MAGGTWGGDIARMLAALRSVVKLARTIGRVSWSLDVDSPKSQSYRDTAGPGTASYQAMLSIVQDDAAGGLPSGLRDTDLLQCLHDLGLRRGEAVSLDVGDVDIDGSTVAVVGKGKTEASRLTLPGPTRKALADWIDSRGTTLPCTPLVS